MSKLWIYGDSYAASFNYLPPDVTPWTRQVSEKLNLEYINKGEHGSSLDYMIHESINDAPNFKSEDTCIFVLTQINRSWQIANDPGQSYLSNREYNIDHHAMLRKSNLLCWIHAMENYTNHFKIKPIIIPAWDPEISYRPKNIGWANGELSKASLDEIIFPHNKKKEHPTTECRLNHLSLCNHNKLSEMVYNWFIKQTIVDCENLNKMIIPLSDFPST
jgi:hypothetical protein